MLGKSFRSLTYSAEKQMQYKKHPDRGALMTDVVKELIDDMNDLKLFREFVLQDPITAEKFEKFKTFNILKSK